MTKDRAKKIMRLLGWGQSETARQFNRVAGTRLGRQNIIAQINGARGVSDSLAVFLRLAARIATLKRRQGGRCRL